MYTYIYEYNYIYIYDYMNIFVCLEPLIRRDPQVAAPAPGPPGPLKKTNRPPCRQVWLPAITNAVRGRERNPAA